MSVPTRSVSYAIAEGEVGRRFEGITINVIHTHDMVIVSPC